MAASPIASISVLLGLDSTQFESGLNKAQGKLAGFGKGANVSTAWAKGLTAAAEEVGGALGGAAANVPLLTSGLSAMGTAGIAASVGLGLAAAGFGLLLEKGRAALEFADEIGDAAQKIGVTTDMLQEYRYAISQAGGDTKDADAALAAFTVTLGKAASGLAPKAAKGFIALGLDAAQEQAKGVDQALRDIADKVKQLGAAPSAAAVDWLGLTPMLPLLRQGADEVERLKKAAHDIGYVMDAGLVAKAGEAQDKLDALTKVVKVQLYSGLVDSKDLILGFAQGFADAAKYARETVGWLQRAKVEEKRGNIAALRASIQEDQVGGAKFMAGDGSRGNPLRFPFLDRWAGRLAKGSEGYTRGLKADLAKQEAELAAMTAAPAAPPPPVTGTGTLTAPPKAGKGGASSGRKPSRTIEQINDELALEAARARGDAAEEERLKNKLDLQKRIREYEDAGLKPAAAQLAARQAIATLQAAQAEASAREVAKLQRAAEIDAARAAGDDERARVLQAQVDLEDRAAAYEREKMPRAQALIQAAKDLNAIDAGRAAARTKALEEDRLQQDLQVAQLAGNVELERTIQRQLDLKQRIAFYTGQELDKATAEARAREDLLRIEQARLAAAQKWAADDGLSRQISLGQARGDDTRGLEREQAIRSRFDQLSKERSDLDPMSALGQAIGDVDEEAQAKLSGVFRSTFRNGVKAALDGDLGEIAQNWWKDRLANALGKAFDGFADALAGAVGGLAKGGGGGGWLSAGLKLLGLPGFATGGSFQVGGAGGVDSNLVAFRATRGEMVNITRPGDMAEPAGFTYAPVIDARGADGPGLRRLEAMMVAQAKALPDLIRNVTIRGLTSGDIRPASYADGF